MTTPQTPPPVITPEEIAALQESCDAVKGEIWLVKQSGHHFSICHPDTDPINWTEAKVQFCCNALAVVPNLLAAYESLSEQASGEYLRGLRDAAKAMCKGCGRNDLRERSSYGDWVHISEQYGISFCYSDEIPTLIAQAQARSKGVEDGK